MIAKAREARLKRVMIGNKLQDVEKSFGETACEETKVSEDEFYFKHGHWENNCKKAIHSLAENLTSSRLSRAILELFYLPWTISQALPEQ